MRRKLTRMVATSTAFAAVAAVAVLTGTAQAALPIGGAATPGQTLTVLSGNVSTAFNFTYGADNACAGDSASGGYRVQTFMVPSSVDVSQLVYNASGPISPVVGGFARPLFSPGAQVNRNTAPTTGIINAGNLVTPFSYSSLAAGGIAVPNGSYLVGLACTLSGITEEFWSTPITVSNSTTRPTTFNWAYGAAPAAPTGVVVTSGDAQLTVAFTPGASEPATTGYTVTATPQGGGAAVTGTGAASPIVVTGLTNGTTYDVVVAATNTVGTGPASSPSVAGTPTLSGLPGVSGLTVVAGATPDIAVLTWTNPAGSNGVTIAVSPTLAGFPVTRGVGVTDYTTVALAPGVYAFTVSATYAAGNPSAPATGGFQVFAGPVIIQDITVVRPTGALVLTQRCGVYGSAAAFSDNVFGALPALAASPANADPDPVNGYSYGGLPTGTAPTPVGAAEFAQYPYPVDTFGIPLVTYSTHCGIDLGIGRLITSGPKAGQYFTANGRMNQITVINTQDVDGGWTLNGRMSAFTRTGGGDSFSGNLLGWNPEVTYDSAANLDGYDMVVQAGGVREATSSASTAGLGDVSNETNTTLAQSLAKSPAASSLGMAVIDARLRLLIPVAANSGTYTGTLTFTTV